MKTKLISSLKIIGVELLGSILIAVGIYNFAAASAFPMTGFSGIALIFNRLFALPVGLTIIVLNVPVAALCYKLLGKQFFLRSVRCMVISSIMIDYLAPCSRYTPEAGCWRQSAQACWPGWAMPLSICRIPLPEAPTLS